MSRKVQAPFTAEQVANLNAWQAAGWTHAFTCTRRDDGKHRTTTDTGVLVATEGGWICPDCSYTQDWAHLAMTKNLPKNPFRVDV